MNFSFHFKNGKFKRYVPKVVKYWGFCVRKTGDKRWQTWKPCILNLVNAPTKKNNLTVRSKCVKNLVYKKIKKHEKTKQLIRKSLTESIRYKNVGAVEFVFHHTLWLWKSKILVHLIYRYVSLCFTFSISNSIFPLQKNHLLTLSDDSIDPV